MREEIYQIFKEKNPLKLHARILNSKLLNNFSETRIYPFTSFKYHLLITCALYYFLSNNIPWQKLYLCENTEVATQFQIVFKSSDREWAFSTNKGMTRVSPKFSKTWLRRTTQSFGGENHILDGLLSQIDSWSAAFATIEVWEALNK